MIHIIISSSCSYNTLKTLIAVNIFPNIEAPKVPNGIPRNLRYCFLISYFTLSLTRSINRPEFSVNFMILIILSLSSFVLT